MGELDDERPTHAKRAEFPVFPVEPGIFSIFPFPFRSDRKKQQVNQSLASQFP
jgi:hypothetical protein